MIGETRPGTNHKKKYGKFIKEYRLRTKSPRPLADLIVEVSREYLEFRSEDSLILLHNLLLIKLGITCYNKGIALKSEGKYLKHQSEILLRGYGVL